MEMNLYFQNSNKKGQIILIAFMLFNPVVFCIPLSEVFGRNAGDEMRPCNTDKINQSNIENVHVSEQNRQTMFEWDHAVPEDVGLSYEKTDSLIVLHKKKKTKKLLIIKDNKIICEWYAPRSKKSKYRVEVMIVKVDNNTWLSGNNIYDG